MRLLILCEYPTVLGGERSMLATLPAVAAGGFEIHVAAPAAGTLADVLRQRGVSHVAWQPRDASGERKPLEHLRADLAEIVRRVQPALVHANSLSTARIAGPVLAECDVASIGHLRDIVKLSRPAIDDLNAHKRLIAVSGATRNFHVSQGLDATRCVTLHNGIDLDEFQPRRATGYLHRELSFPPDARLVAVVGQLGLRKGTEVALTAAWQAATELPDLHWLVVGERTSEKEESREFEALLRSLEAEAPLAGRAHFLGRREDMPQLLAECTLLVHAARQEPLGRVLLEAAAAGLPVVATDVGGTREIFPSESDGATLVRPDNAGALAEAVVSLARDDVRRLQMGEAGRRRAEQAFDIRQAAARLVEQYRIVLDS